MLDIKTIEDIVNYEEEKKEMIKTYKYKPIVDEFKYGKLDENLIENGMTTNKEYACKEMQKQQEKKYIIQIAILKAYVSEVNSIVPLNKDEKADKNIIPSTSDTEGDLLRALKLLKRCGFIKGDISVDDQGNLTINWETDENNIVEGVICGDILEAYKRGYFNHQLLNILLDIKQNSNQRIADKLHLMKGNHDFFFGSWLVSHATEIEQYKKLIYPYLENRWVAKRKNNKGEDVFFVFQHAFFIDSNSALKKKLGEDYNDYKNAILKDKWQNENDCDIMSFYDPNKINEYKGFYKQAEQLGALGFFPSIDNSSEGRTKESFKRNDIPNRISLLAENLKNDYPGIKEGNIKVVIGHEKSYFSGYPEYLQIGLHYYYDHKYLENEYKDDITNNPDLKKEKNIFMIDYEKGNPIIDINPNCIHIKELLKDGKKMTLQETYDLDKRVENNYKKEYQRLKSLFKEKNTTDTHKGVPLFEKKVDLELILSISACVLSVFAITFGVLQLTNVIKDLPNAFGIITICSGALMIGVATYILAGRIKRANRDKHGYKKMKNNLQYSLNNTTIDKNII